MRMPELERGCSVEKVSIDVPSTEIHTYIYKNKKNHIGSELEI